MPPSKNAPRLVRSDTRRAAILKRRGEGVTFKELAAEFKISQRWAREIVAHEFKRLTDERNQLAEDALGIALRRLDDLYHAVEEEALEGSLDHVKAAASIVEKQLRVLGLRQPREDDQPALNVHFHLEERAAALGLTLEQLRGKMPALPAPVYPVVAVEATAVVR